VTYGTAMALTGVTVFSGAAIVTALGREKRGHEFGQDPASAASTSAA